VPLSADLYTMKSRAVETQARWDAKRAAREQRQRAEQQQSLREFRRQVRCGQGDGCMRACTRSADRLVCLALPAHRALGGAAARVPLRVRVEITGSIMIRTG
jgi:hypothetical protein